MISVCYQNVLYFIASLCIEIRFVEDGEQIVKLKCEEVEERWIWDCLGLET